MAKCARRFMALKGSRTSQVLRGVHTGRPASKGEGRKEVVRALRLKLAKKPCVDPAGIIDR